ncbi:MAG: GTP-binding protein, partial [Clostridia bacterium]|nr:GTP-binding protein [Clostridia bacterium]
MRKIVFGILAHVDSGKTTLSEELLYLSGKIRQKGRVDTKNAYLDTNSIEKDRGITIYSKQAVFDYNNTSFTLIDTPGHVDFSAEAECALGVLDCAVLLISAPDGIKSHTKTLWELLKKHKIPTFIFVNKTDLEGFDKEEILKTLS